MLHLGADAGFEHLAPINQLVIDLRLNLHTQAVLLKHVSKAQDGAFIREAVSACILLCKFTVQRVVVQGIFHGKVGVSEVLLKQRIRSITLVANGESPSNWLSFQ